MTAKMNLEKMWEVFDKNGIGQVCFENQVVETKYIEKRMANISSLINESKFIEAERVIRDELFPIFRYEIRDVEKFKKNTIAGGEFDKLPEDLYAAIMMELGMDEDKGINIGFRKKLLSGKNEKETNVEKWCEENDKQYKMEKMFDKEKANKKQEIKIIKQAFMVFSSNEAKSVKEKIVKEVLNEVVLSIKGEK